MMKNNQKMLDWYQKEIKKDDLELSHLKKNLINQIKKEKKENFFETPKKLSLWRRILKSLMNI